jgi:hypothetical protein
MFMHLPVQIRNIISTREIDRERNLRRGQNEIAEQRKALEQLIRLQADAEPKSADNTESETTNG